MGKGCGLPIGKKPKLKFGIPRQTQDFRSVDVAFAENRGEVKPTKNSPSMIRILLLALSVVLLGSTAGVRIDELKNQPDLITKESILEDYLEFTPLLPPLFTNITQLVFVTDWSPRGYVFTGINAKRILYVSFAWFTVVPDFDAFGKCTGLKIQGVEMNENKLLRIAQAIAKFCHKNGFDGAVIKALTPLSDGIFYEDIIAGNNPDLVDLYRDMLETLEQVGTVIRKSGLIAIFSMKSPITLHNMDQEKKFFALPPDFSHKMIEAYDFVHVWYRDLELLNRQYIHDRLLEEIMKFFNYSPKLLMGINFFGYEFPLDEYRKGGNGKKWTVISYERFLEILRKDDAVFTFNEVNKEHELISESANAFIVYPSRTQLEYSLAHIKQHPGVGIGIWEYGQGLDYFVNLV
ncbi:unnamed protein product [Caenorhabditis brenneri]